MVARLQLLGVRGTRGLSPGGRGPRPPATGHDALGDTLDARMRTALETAQVRRNPTESGMLMGGHRTSKRLSPKMAKSQDVVASFARTRLFKRTSSAGRHEWRGRSTMRFSAGR
jgi:hypothetical protein